MLVSGQEPKEPVISPAGYVFEKSLIEKYLAQNDNCPITGDPLSVEELIPIKSMLKQSKQKIETVLLIFIQQIVNKAVQPRPTGSASIPGLLQIFQNEWDASVLETFTLKKQLDTVSFEILFDQQNFLVLL